MISVGIAMASFKKASEIHEMDKRAFVPEIKDVLIRHIKSFGRPVTVTSAIVELNKNGLNPSRSVVRRHLDELAESGFLDVSLNGNVYEYRIKRKV
ncbi:hypothetical protein J2128_000510 [Methanomicrobium sp. W14]|uniref:hypothetical protein n=1 Tax=Methanomicrobium sp. W14 TaxID=2817839 RepID=UPI001AE5077D|nr:hypothetical protein [Methanomicrobium sp. W14]MBP2132589.1 hypothetical protein [Methanomicrobium sp. W14]